MLRLWCPLAGDSATTLSGKGEGRGFQKRKYLLYLLICLLLKYIIFYYFYYFKPNLIILNSLNTTTADLKPIYSVFNFLSHDMYFDAIQWILSEELQRKGNFGVSFKRIQIFPIAVAAATKISRRRPIPIRHRLTSRPIVPHRKRNRSQVKQNVMYQECTAQPLNWNTRNVFIKSLIINWILI